jgi:hypothetical protein
MITAAATGALEEMGWNDDAEQAGQLDRAATAALLLVVGGAYWGSVWVLGGLAPLGYLATRVGCDLSNGKRRWGRR